MSTYCLHVIKETNEEIRQKKSFSALRKIPIKANFNHLKIYICSILNNEKNFLSRKLHRITSNIFRGPQSNPAQRMTQILSVFGNLMLRRKIGPF